MGENNLVGMWQRIAALTDDVHGGMQIIEIRNYYPDGTIEEETQIYFSQSGLRLRGKTVAEALSTLS